MIIIRDGGGRNIVSKACRLITTSTISNNHEGGEVSHQTLSRPANGAVSYRASEAMKALFLPSFLKRPQSKRARFLSTRSTPKRRHARLFSNDVPKIVTRDRIYDRRDLFIRSQCVTALSFAEIFRNFFLQFQ
jgi:hypothetical protein